MAFTGKIKTLKPRQNGSSYGYIVSDTSLKEWHRDIRFWEDKLIDADFQNLSIGDLVEFETDQWYRNDGQTETVAIKVKVVKQVSVTQSKTVEITTKRLKAGLVELIGNAKNILDSDEFEDTVFFLLRMIGIHKLYQYNRKNAAGKADGFFVLGDLAVVYDCTLNTNFSDFKEDQIDNYVGQINRDVFKIRMQQNNNLIEKIIPIPSKKQVWVITKGKSQEHKQVGNVKVKEVSIQSLIKVFQFRINAQLLEEENLALWLENIERVKTN